MIVKYINKTISVFLTLIFTAGLFPPVVFAQPNQSSGLGEVRGFNKSILDSHFSRADRELSPERWLEEAKFGLSQAICAWELTANDLFHNPLLFEEEKNKLEKWSNEELEKRFTQWLLGRFFGEAAEDAVMNVTQALRAEYGEMDKAGEIINLNSISFNNAMIALFPELLAYIPVELRKTMDAVIYETAGVKSSAVKREFENIAVREESVLISRRTRDARSLRNKSENEAARVFTEKLIAETEKTCNSGIEEINIRIEQAAAGTGDLALLGEEWLSLYKEQFERGLKAWEEAEERFFIRRIEWEQESFKLFSEGEEIWLAAFDQFERERRSWELKAKELFDNGEKMFENLSEEFNKNMENARKEFALNMEMRIGEGTSKTEALINMYLVCASAAILAKENAEFWSSRENEHEAEKFNDMYLSYMDKALDARDRILSDYAELLGTGALKDILSDDASSEDFFLDEYQTALLRAKALVLYWERKTKISEAVVLYAGESGAGKITEAEGIRAWEDAKNAYNSAVAAYEFELNKLNSTGEDINEQRGILQALAERMLEEEEKLTRINSEYMVFISFAAVNQNVNYEQEYYTIYRNIARKHDSLIIETYSDYRIIMETGMLWANAGRDEAYELYMDMLNDDELSVEEREAIERQIDKLSVNAQMEALDNMHESLLLLFNSYGIEAGHYKLPNIQEISEAILSRDGDFVHNTIVFINEFTDCMPFLHEWIEYEIGNWINALVDYIAANAFCSGLIPEKSAEELAGEYQEVMNKYFLLYDYVTSLENIPDDEAELINDELTELTNKMFTIGYAGQIFEAWNNLNAAYINGEKNWRQYLHNELLAFRNAPYFPFEKAASFQEAVLEDAQITASYSSNRINNAFNIYSNIGSYDPAENSEFYFAEYTSALCGYVDPFDSLKDHHEEMINIINAYIYSGKTKEGLDEKMAEIDEKVMAQKEIYEEIRSQYFLEAENFMGLGYSYEQQYSVSKKAYENIEQKRFEYEKQDAIQRWASTAYLNIDYNELNNCAEKLKRAQTVLDVLSDLYGKEEKRPYNDPEYDAIYSAYEQSFGRKIKILETIEIVMASMADEKRTNDILLAEYNNSLAKLGYINTDYENYFLSNDRAKWDLINIITVNDGRLSFSRDDLMNVSGVNNSEAEVVSNYFNSVVSSGNDQFDSTLFQKSLAELSQRMEGYLSSDDKFKQWGLARDYLITSLINQNSDLIFLQNYYSGIGLLKENGSLRNLWVIRDVYFFVNDYVDLYSFISGDSVVANAQSMFSEAWNHLSDEEKLDLEFYVILTLSGAGNDYLKGFSQVYTYNVYEHAYSKVNRDYQWARNKNSNIFTFGVYREMESVNKNTLGRIEPVKNAAMKQVDKWISGFKANISSINSNYTALVESCNRLAELDNKKTDGQSIEWADIEFTLLENENFNANYISELNSCWALLKSNSNKKYFSVSDALIDMFNLASEEEINSKNALENKWLNDLYRQKVNEENFIAAIDEYIAGNINSASLKKAAENSYGKKAAAWKNHLDNTHTALINNLSIYMDMNKDFRFYFNILGEELISLTERTLQNRYRAELSAREIEWSQTLNDLKDKFADWQKTAAMILENGRTDWIESSRKMTEARNQWTVNFKNEYERVSAQWAEIYLAGLEDKEMWLRQAADAANQASSESFLSLVGTEGERLSRFIDTREPFGIRDAAPHAQTLMAELLQSSGIVNMSNAFGSMYNIAGTVSVIARGNLGGGSTWDSALVKIAASDLAKKTNEEIAGSEVRKIAYMAGLSAAKAIEMLAENAESANQSFKNSMDNIFIFEGLWTKRGNNYVKEIVKGSTLISPVITESVTIKGFNNYVMEPVKLKTNMDENYLQTLDSITIHKLLENVYRELDIITKEIFGIGEEPKEISRDRVQSPGKFGAYIGYDPAIKPQNEIGKKRSEIFYDEGAGELGRLLSDYFYWSVIDNLGYAQLSLAPWDRRIWDDEGGFFSAPTLREAGQIAGAVIATAFIAPLTAGAGLGLTIGLTAGMAGVSSAGDLVFGALDVVHGFKSLDEAAFTWGKSFLTNMSTGLVTSAFGGLSTLAAGAASTTAGKVVTQTLMTGAQTYTSTLVSSALSGISYNSADGFGYNTDIFDAGMKGAGINMLTSMTSALTASSLTAINSGLDLSKLIGFNALNKRDIGNLNSLVGSLAGQGVSYALGNDFSLNVLNLGLLSGGQYQSGLLELNLGRDGASMKFGTGGANVSMDNLGSALRGAQVWNVNNRISNYGEQNNFNALITLRAQYGYGDNVQKSQLYDILNGDTILTTNADDNYAAKTSIDENGSRIVNLAAYQQGMSMEDQFLLAAVLGHEAYRDGYVTSDNNLETQASVKAHTEMALRMLAGKEGIAYDDNLSRDINEYLAAKMADNISSFNNYVDNNYDSSADYWKLTKDGRLLYDGKTDLYDEEGRLIKKAKSTTLSGSLGEWMGITQPAAKKIMEDEYGMVHSGKTTWTSPSNEGYGAMALPQYQAQYEIQRNYIDKIATKYNNSMLEALDAMLKEKTSNMKFYNNEERVIARLMINEYGNLLKLAQEYDVFIHGNEKTAGAWSAQKYDQYTSKEAGKAYSQVLYDLQNKNNTDDNSIYTHYAFGGILFNIGADYARTTTKMYYDDNPATPHWVTNNGIAIDIGGVEGMPIYTTRNESIPTMIDTFTNLSNSYGVNIKTQTENLSYIYAHMKDDYLNKTTVQGRLYNVLNMAQRANVYSIALLPGTMIGRVGNTGYSTGPHLHFEINNK